MIYDIVNDFSVWWWGKETTESDQDKMAAGGERGKKKAPKSSYIAKTFAFSLTIETDANNSIKNNG